MLAAYAVHELSQECGRGIILPPQRRAGEVITSVIVWIRWKIRSPVVIEVYFPRFCVQRNILLPPVACELKDYSRAEKKYCQLISRSICVATGIRHDFMVNRLASRDQQSQHERYFWNLFPATIYNSVILKNTSYTTPVSSRREASIYV